MISTTWTSIKSIKTATSNILYYSIENQYHCNVDEGCDIDRYYIRIQDGMEEFYCFIPIEDPANADQADFDDNYKSAAILLE